MPLELIQVDHDFHLARDNRGFRLVVKCAEHLAAYNNAPLVNWRKFFSHQVLFPTGDAALYVRFANAAALHPLEDAIKFLESSYKLHGYLTRCHIPARLIRHLPAIREVNEAQPIGPGTIGMATDAFAHWSEMLHIPSTAEVSASKLLHFINPNVFWIIDSRVKIILDVWGYEPSFSGFGKLLTELMQHNDFGPLQDFLTAQNGGVCPFLKLLDKVLLLPPTPRAG